MSWHPYLSETLPQAEIYSPGSFFCPAVFTAKGVAEFSTDNFSSV